MKFEYLELENYGSFFGKHRLDLADRGLLLVSGDNRDDPRTSSNGAGKSTIFDALDWALFGAVPRGDRVESVVNAEASECRVRVGIRTDSGEALVVERTRVEGATGLALWQGGQEVRCLDVTETQNVLEQKLGLDREVFHAAVLFSQGDLTHYADETDAGKMDILTRILQLGVIDQLQGVAKKRLAALEEELLEVDRVLVDIRGQISGLESAGVASQAQAWEEQRQKELAFVRAEIVRRQQAIQQLPVSTGLSAGAIRAEMEALQKSGAAYGSPEERSALLAAEQAVAEWKAELRQRDQEIGIIRGEMERFRTFKGEVCSLCGQPVTQEHLGREYALRGQKLQGLLQAKGEAESTLGAWEARLGELKASEQAKNRALQERIAAERSKLYVLQESLRKAEALEREGIEAQRAFQAERDKAEEVFRRVNPFQAQQAELDKKRQELEWRLKTTEHLLGQQMLLKEHIFFWVKALGAKGLKSYILDQRLQELSDAVNGWLAPLTGGAMWCRFDSTKQTKTRGVQNSPTLRIFRWEGDGVVAERGYKSWSGGEKQRISFAVDFGLSRLLARRARNQYDLLILDEVFKHLDSSGKEAVVEMLHAIAQEKSSVFVVEHDHELQGSFERVMVVQKIKRRSQIKEGSDGIQIKAKKAIKRAPVHHVSGEALPAGKSCRAPLRRAPIIGG